MTEGEKMGSRPWLPPVSDERMQQIIDCNAALAVFKNADCVLVGDILSLIEEARLSRRARRPAPSAGEVAQRLSHPVFAFLLGEGPLNGLWFGDAPPKKAGVRPKPHWWRAHLRAALTPPPPTGEDA